MQYFTTCVYVYSCRMLNICTHVIEDQSPSTPQSKTLPSLPTAPSLSPIKSKAKRVKDDVAEKINSPSEEKKKEKSKDKEKGIDFKEICYQNEV